MQKHVVLPNYLAEGIRPLRQCFPKRPNLIVFDTETESRITGEPYLLTFYDGIKPQYLRVDTETILTEFMEYLISRCTRHKSNILFAHNLQFDLTAVLCKKQCEIFRWLKPPPIQAYNGNELLGTIEVFPQKTWFAQVKLSNRANAKVVDSGNFIRGSLHEISRALELPHKKETKPDWLGRRPEGKKEWKELIRYCLHEIRAEYELTRLILGIHEKYDIQFTVSTAQLGSKVFRRHFLKQRIPQVPPHVRRLAELCIHGGRAGCFVKTPIVIPDIRMYDYDSFYSWSMATLPPMTKGVWEKVDEFVDGSEGFYQITGKVAKCTYPVVTKSPSRFDYANGQHVKDIPVSSYELREALRKDEIEIDEITGWVWNPKETAENPFADFVEHFYRLKNQSRDNFPLYTQNKLLLNSLYGKTYQAIRQTDSRKNPNSSAIPRLDV